jgi:hypothetical protein
VKASYTFFYDATIIKETKPVKMAAKDAKKGAITNGKRESE